ncbi:class I SAM-dependent methyltransferase [Clostridium swellfunianum]|uniref:class I SAM-dependent methyltransferase n=1 Tax=Clostridium swellfunianum TaxID=1367462 RepID=UPI00202DBAA7|nr:class I SAM-dependent methyltransferase [Clostridium swellfunianum]MCM0648462.1 class I SAM-dependent methyltransferase [Clostridium swellfunianum]
MKFEHLYKVGKDIYIDMQNEVFTGNVLDVGLNNYGIIYNLYKLQNENATVEYIQGKDEKQYIENNSYDNCVLLFALSNLWLKSGKKHLIEDMSKFLKNDGILHIWDIDKSFSSLFRGKIKALLPDNIIKEINITDLNILKDCSKENTIKLLEQYFEIIDLKDYDKVYYIKARNRMCFADSQKTLQNEMKGSVKHENSFSSNKFKVRSQQFSSKISESLHKRFKL